MDLVGRLGLLLEHPRAVKLERTLRRLDEPGSGASIALHAACVLLHARVARKHYRAGNPRRLVWRAIALGAEWERLARSLAALAKRRGTEAHDEPSLVYRSFPCAPHRVAGPAGKTVEGNRRLAEMIAAMPPGHHIFSGPDPPVDAFRPQPMLLDPGSVLADPSRALARIAAEDDPRNGTILQRLVRMSERPETQPGRDGLYHDAPGRDGQRPREQ